VHFQHAVGRLLLILVEWQVVLHTDFRDAHGALHLLDVPFDIGPQLARGEIDFAR
jgi:hypothetical protein